MNWASTILSLKLPHITLHNLDCHKKKKYRISAFIFTVHIAAYNPCAHRIIESSITEDSHPKPIFLYNESFSYHGNENTTERKKNSKFDEAIILFTATTLYYHRNGNATEKACTIMTALKWQKVVRENPNNNGCARQPCDGELCRADNFETKSDRFWRQPGEV